MFKSKEISYLSFPLRTGSGTRADAATGANPSMPVFLLLKATATRHDDGFRLVGVVELRVHCRLDGTLRRLSVGRGWRRRAGRGELDRGISTTIQSLLAFQ